MSGYTGTRKSIRDNVVSLLKGGITGVSDASISSCRAEPMYSEELKAINVYTGEDVCNTNKKYDFEFERTVELRIEIMVRRSTNIIPEDVADAIAGKIEDRLLPNKFLQYPPSENLQIGSEGDPGTEIIQEIMLQSIGEAKTAEGLEDVYALIMLFSVIYQYETLRGAAVPFETADVMYDLAGEQAVADQAHDTIELPQP